MAYYILNQILIIIERNLHKSLTKNHIINIILKDKFFKANFKLC